MGSNSIFLWLFLLLYYCQKADLFSLMKTFCNEIISQNPSLFCTAGDQGEKGSRGMTGQ